MHDKISHLGVELEKSKIPDKEKEKDTPTIHPPPEIKDFKLSKFDNIERLLQERIQGLNINPLQLSEKDITDRNNIPNEIDKISEKHAKNRFEECITILGRVLKIFSWRSKNIMSSIVLVG